MLSLFRHWRRRVEEREKRRVEEAVASFQAEAGQYVLLVFTGHVSPHLRANLDMAGYRTAYAHSNVEALAKMRKYRPGFLLCYGGTIVPDGPELLRETRNDTTLGGVPVLAVIYGGGLPEARQMKRLGATRCLIHPFHPSEVVAFAREVMPQAEGAAQA